MLPTESAENPVCIFYDPATGKCHSKKCNYGRRIDGLCKAEGDLNRLVKEPYRNVRE